MKRALAIGAAAAAWTVPTAAEVRSTGPDRFEIEHRIDSALPPGALYALIGQPARWWSDAHTYSGKAANLSVDLVPMGCWCERMPDGKVVTHLRVGITQPGRRLLLIGLLGPLSTVAKAGAMNWTITPKGRGSTLVMNYKVGGMSADKVAPLAPAVDGVLGEQMTRLRKTAEDLAPSR
ncbi:uncharacterized protein YndB with AHSA1/START domain [Sphingomonas kaistensis]|uniref:Uncharacterized protein YndB with AHSA1/START domain n=1 Tax=Sphingomonas kaistensis TaxID=298708 RepID=A0A7X5Y5J0_9SPHN|nr:ATPase [Sphingomonas kaistensis]NJC05517.1 uncharacterized protein YndB with AHSA1/START domain [Sphingomonas kaistensis]